MLGATILFLGLALAGDGDAQLFEFDPIELIAGREVAGKEDLELTRYRFTYRFVSEENRAKFLSDPERFEIQMGGGCARMGSLGGAGRAKLFEVRDAKIWVFASNQCREGWKKSPERLLERADEVPASTQESARRGRELLDLAVKGIGGAERLDALTTLRRAWKRPMKLEGEDVEEGEVQIAQFPGRVRRDRFYGEKYRHSTIESGDDAWFWSKSGGDETMHPWSRAEYRRMCSRDPLVILKARDREGFVAVDAGRGDLDGRAVERVTVAFDGATTTLALDPSTGRILSTTHRGRGPSGGFGPLETRFVDWRDTGGLSLPVRSEAWFEGARAAALDDVWDELEADPEIDPATFSRTP